MSQYYSMCMPLSLSLQIKWQVFIKRLLLARKNICTAAFFSDFDEATKIVMCVWLCPGSNHFLSPRNSFFLFFIIFSRLTFSCWREVLICDQNKENKTHEKYKSGRLQSAHSKNHCCFIGLNLVFANDQQQQQQEMKFLFSSAVVFLLLGVHFLLLLPGSDALIEPQDDERRTFGELILSRGYVLIQHKVVTDDNYIITLDRVVRPGEPKGKPVVLFHGIWCQSSVFFVNSPEDEEDQSEHGPNLGFALLEAGYDLWLPNAVSFHFSILIFFICSKLFCFYSSAVTASATSTST